MTDKVLIRDASGERRYDRADLPLVFGGDDADIAVPGLTNGARVAFLGISGDAPFLQPARDAAAIVLVNGERLDASRWLRTGDVVQVGDQRMALDVSAAQIGLSVTDDQQERATMPPLIATPFETGTRTPLQVEPAAAVDGDAGRIEATVFVPTSGDSRQWIPRLALMPLLVVAALAVLATVAWYMFTARPVQLAVTPVPDSITIDGASVDFALRDRYLLRPGSYSVVVEKEGYETALRNIEVTRAEGQSHLIDLVMLPGLIDIDTGVVTDAVITIDGEVRGNTPVAGLELKQGVYNIELTAPGYLPATSEITVQGRGQRQQLSLTLVENQAPMTLISTPPGATLLVDEMAVGTTPFDGKIAGGLRTVALQLAGHKTWETQVDVTAGEAVVIEPVTLEPADGMVSVTTSPPGAAVTVDGQYRGQSPLRLKLAPNHSYRLGFTLAGHEPASRRVAVAPEEGASISVALTANLGEVSVAASPADAIVYVDGEPRGAANQTLRLTAVQHRIEIRKPGYATHKATVTPTPGFAQAISATLATVTQAAVAAAPAVVKTSGGYEMVRIAPGNFTMGSSRREPGRRANEVLRPVQLTRPYFIGSKPVTNREFAIFDGSHDSGDVRGVRLDAPDQPVVNIDWDQAARYCNWLSGVESLPPAYVEKDGKMVAAEPMTKGFRLPTEAEWAWAARYAAGQSDTRYPWGDAMPPAAKSGNYADASAGRLVASFVGRYHDGFPATSPVGSFAPNAAGLYDVGGNVAEWMHDYYAVNPSTGRGPAIDPFGPDEGVHRVVRGSSWMRGSASDLRLAYRDYSDTKRPDIGFRLVRFTQ